MFLEVGFKFLQLGLFHSFSTRGVSVSVTLLLVQQNKVIGFLIFGQGF